LGPGGGAQNVHHLLRGERAARFGVGEQHFRAALLLGLADGERVIVRDRRYLLDGKPVLLARSYLPASLVSGSQITQPDTGPGGTYARLHDLGHTPTHFREELRARMPEPSEVSTLDLAPGTPVIEVIRTAYTSDGQPVEVNEMVADASAYVFRYDFTT
jgi:GntR family transcriptional regulator